MMRGSGKQTRSIQDRGAVAPLAEPAPSARVGHLSAGLVSGFVRIDKLEQQVEKLETEINALKQNPTGLPLCHRAGAVVAWLAGTAGGWVSNTNTPSIVFTAACSCTSSAGCTVDCVLACAAVGWVTVLGSLRLNDS